MSTSGVDGGGSAIISGYNGGMGTFQRAVFCLDELTTDTYMWCWPNDEGAAYNALNVDNFPSTNVIFYGTYSRMYVIISICNEFIKNVEQGILPINDELRPRAEEYVRQARIIRGLSYFYLVDLFGNRGLERRESSGSGHPAADDPQRDIRSGRGRSRECQCRLRSRLCRTGLRLCGQGGLRRPSGQVLS